MKYVNQQRVLFNVHIYFFGLGCIDVDECLDDTIYNEYCGTNTLCTNTIGSFYCGCLPGYHRWVAGEGVNKFTTLIANYFLLTFSFFLIKELTFTSSLLSAKKICSLRQGCCASDTEDTCSSSYDPCLLAAGTGILTSHSDTETQYSNNVQSHWHIR